jgi:hypothetical protein
MAYVQCPRYASALVFPKNHLGSAIPTIFNERALSERGPRNRRVTGTGVLSVFGVSSVA